VDLQAPFGPYSKMPRELPDDAKLLLHDRHLTLGIGRRVVSDAIAWQLGIDYTKHPSPSAMWTLLHSHGVTHVAWKHNRGFGLSSIADDVAFHYFASNHLDEVRSVDGFRVGTLPAEAPSDQTFFGKAAVLGCQDAYDNGIYELQALTATRLRGAPKKSTLPNPQTVIEPTLTEEQARKLLSEVDAVWLEAKCFDLPKKLQHLGFKKAHARKGAALYVRITDR
jgi:hypothetical protein